MDLNHTLLSDSISDSAITTTSCIKDQTDSSLPEVHTFDVSGNDKYFVSQEEAQNVPFLRDNKINVSSSTEIHLEDGANLPERTYEDGDKEAFQITHSVGYLERRSDPNVEKEISKELSQQSSHFRIKRSYLILGVATLIVIIVAVVFGAVFGVRSNKSSSRTTSTPQSTANPESSVGGYLNPEYYSKRGAWNGTGLSIASADATSDYMFVFYQDFSGNITYQISGANNSFREGTVVNDGVYRPLNGTPISSVLHSLGDLLRWHVFYVDEDYYIRERVMTNVSKTWVDGPLTENNLKTFVADKVGMTACYHGDYYGAYSGNGTQATAGIYLWFATSEMQFMQYSWANGTNDWIFQKNFDGIDGHGTFGCETWFSMTEYIFYINNNQEIDWYWQDSNRSETNTSTHPIGIWNKGSSLDLQSIYKASPIGFTNYLVYQSIDQSIRGVNITFAAENTTVAEDASTGKRDTWILTNPSTGNPVTALGGTQLAITAYVTGGGNAVSTAIFQERGDDISVYTRDATNESAAWQSIGNIV